MRTSTLWLARSVLLTTPTACALFMQNSADDVQSQPPADQLRELLREQPERSQEEGRRGGEGEAAAAAGEVSGTDDNIINNSIETPGVDGVPQPAPPALSETSPPSSVKSNVAPPAAIKRFSSTTISKTFMMKATSSPTSASISGSQSSKSTNGGSSATCEFLRVIAQYVTFPLHFV